MNHRSTTPETISSLGIKRFIGRDFQDLHRHQHLTSFPLQVLHDDHGMAVFDVGANNDAKAFRAPELLAHVGDHVIVVGTINLLT